MTTPTEEILDQEVTGRALRILRTARGLKQTELAERSGFAVSQLSRWEHRSMTPNLENLERLMEALDLPMEALFEAQRFVRWVAASTQHGKGNATTRPAWTRSDEIREPQVRWQAEPAEGESRAEELTRLFRAWIREEVRRTVDRT